MIVKLFTENQNSILIQIALPTILTGISDISDEDEGTWLNTKTSFLKLPFSAELLKLPLHYTCNAQTQYVLFILKRGKQQKLIGKAGRYVANGRYKCGCQEDAG